MANTKNVILGLIVFFLQINIFAKVEILSQSGNLIEFVLTYNKVEINDTENIFPNRRFLQNQYGRIPYFEYNFIITNLNSVSVKYEIIDSLDISQEDFIYPDTLFNILPSKPIIASSPFILRDFRGIKISSYPYKKTPTTILLYNKIIVKIITDVNIGKNLLYNQHEKIPLFFDDIYKYFFENYSYYKTDDLISEKAIIIYEQETEASANILCDNLTDNAIKSDYYLYPQDTGTGEFALKNFIKKIYYDNSDFTFLIFVSDNKNEFINIGFFSEIAGKDSLPDLFVSKIYTDSVKNDSFEHIYSPLFKYNFVTRDLFYKRANNLQNQTEKILFTDKSFLQQGYYLPMGKEKFKRFIFFYDKIVNDKSGGIYYSEIPFIFMLLYHQPFKSFVNPAIMIKEIETNKFSSIIRKTSENPLSLEIETFQENQPLKNCLVSVNYNDKILDAGYTDDRGVIRFDLETEESDPLFKVIFSNKLIGKNVGFYQVQSDNHFVTDTLSTFIQLFPNPYYINKEKKDLNITYELKKNAYVSATIYNIVGQTIKKLQSGFQNEGPHTIYWNGKDSNNNYVSNGIYYLMIKIDDKTEIKKISIVK